MLMLLLRRHADAAFRSADGFAMPAKLLPRYFAPCCRAMPMLFKKWRYGALLPYACQLSQRHAYAPLLSPRHYAILHHIHELPMPRFDADMVLFAMPLLLPDAATAFDADAACHISLCHVFSPRCCFRL